MRLQAVGFIAGYVQQSFDLTFKFWAVGTALAALLVLPPWPFYSRHPVRWLPQVTTPPASRQSQGGEQQLQQHGGKEAAAGPSSAHKRGVAGDDRG
jgi:hypothetical protein